MKTKEPVLRAFVDGHWVCVDLSTGTLTVSYPPCEPYGKTRHWRLSESMSDEAIMKARLGQCNKEQW